MAFLHPGLPVQEDLLQLVDGQVGEVHSVLPALESGQAPACFHSCVGRIRYLGNVLLYDADRSIRKMAKLPTTSWSRRSAT